MTFPGLGGQQPPPQNAPPAQTPVPGITPGVPSVLTVTEIVIVPGGQLEGIFTYSSKPPAAGTLIESASVAVAGTDAYGNHYVAGHATYASTFAAALGAGFVQFYTGSLSAGWTAGAVVETDGAKGLILSGTAVQTPNNVLDDGSGNASVAGALTLGTPLAVSGTSGAASAGTAHTHGAGTYEAG